MTTVRIRRATHRDVGEIVALQHACYPSLSRFTRWTPRSLEMHQDIFPQGQFVAEAGGKVVGHCANLIVGSHRALRPHTYAEITGQSTFVTHDPEGDTLYGAEVMVHPDQRRQGIGSRFYRARFRLARRLGLHYYVTGGRLPGYHKMRHKYSIEEYVRRVVAGDAYDRVLSMQRRVGLQVHGLLQNYLPDPKSDTYASLLVWENPAWKAAEAASVAPVPALRSRRRRRVPGLEARAPRPGLTPRPSFTPER